MADIVELEVDGHVAVLTIRRPDALNALGEEGDGDVFARVCAAVNANRNVRCAILTGEGRAFSAGGNVKAMKARTGAFSGSPADVREAYRNNIHRIVRSLWGLEVPSIAAVNGAAIGLGCDVACMTDMRIASADAKFGVTFLKVGLIPGDGGAWLLPRTVGMSRAAELLFTGDVIDAETAAAWGLVSRVVPPEALMREAMALAHKIAAQPPHALRTTKALLRAGQTGTYETLMEMSAAAQGLMHHTKDHEEALDAMFAKRPAQFTGE
jgi:enoyl-CoA hydratase/carnithine racemase